jgi:hypothetical protein
VGAILFAESHAETVDECLATGAYGCRWKAAPDDTLIMLPRTRRRMRGITVAVGRTMAADDQLISSSSLPSGKTDKCIAPALGSAGDLSQSAHRKLDHVRGERLDVASAETQGRKQSF